MDQPLTAGSLTGLEYIKKQERIGYDTYKMGCK